MDLLIEKRRLVDRFQNHMEDEDGKLVIILQKCIVLFQKTKNRKSQSSKGPFAPRYHYLLASKLLENCSCPRVSVLPETMGKGG